MSERFDIEGLRPRDVISFADMRELVAFEDLLGPIIDPKISLTNWEARPNLGNFVRPAKFNGTIRDITLSSMEYPYERLLDANERGWKFSPGSGIGGSVAARRAEEGAQWSRNSYVGFSFDAEAHSSNPDLRGRIAAELWYFPVPLSLILTAGTEIRTPSRYVRKKTGETVEYTWRARKDVFARNDSTTGQAIRRVVTRPRYDKQRFEAAHNASCAIGYAVLADALRTIISTPMRD